VGIFKPIPILLNIVGFGRKPNARRRKKEAVMDQEQPVRKGDRRAKLTEEDVAQIKAHLREGKTPAALARHFKVHHVTICKIRDMKRWRRVEPATEAIPLSELHKTKRRV
jgi:hypothetical protein